MRPVLGIDGYDRRMGRVAEGAAVALGTIAFDDLEAAAIDVGWKVLRLQIPATRDVAQGDAVVLARHAAIGDGNVGWGVLKKPRADRGYACGEYARCRGDRAAAHDDRPRTPGRGGIGGVQAYRLASP